MVSIPKGDNLPFDKIMALAFAILLVILVFQGA